MESEQAHEDQRIVLPLKTLIVLCGPAGAGKSTFAHSVIKKHRHLGYKETMIVSSDHCRAMVCDDITNQQVNHDTFDLFHYIIHKRMSQGRLTIADSTALQSEARQRLLELAQRHHYFTCLIIFNMSLDTCKEYDKHAMRGRSVGEQVIAYHLGLLQQALQVIPTEGWNQVHILDEQQPTKEIIITTTPFPTN